MTNEWLPVRSEELPGTWAMATLAELGAEAKPGFASGRHSRIPSGQVPHLRPMNVDTKGHLDLSDVKYVSADAGEARLRLGDVLFNNTNSAELVGKTAYVALGQDLAFSNHITRIRVREISPKYVAYQLQLLQRCGYFRHLCVKHVNQASVTSSTLSNAVPLAVAPSAEQERIVAVIEEQFSRLDDAEQLLQRARRRCAQMRFAVLEQAVNGDWPSKPLSELLVSLRNGAFVSRPSPDPPGVPIFRISAVRPLNLNVSDVRYAPLSGDEAKPFMVSAGDLLFTRYSGNPSYVGSCAVVPVAGEGIVHPDKLIRAVVDRAVVAPEFVAIAVNVGAGRRQVEARLKTTAGQVGIAGSQLKTIEVPLPPLDEQRRIVSVVESDLTILESLTTAIDNALTRSTYLSRSVLHRAYSGRLVPQEPTDEPASDLLARIATEHGATTTSRRRQRA